MSIDSRYDGFLCDLITLFEELAVRYINEKQIDLHKFMHYFNKFYDHMESLESAFHENKLKITKYLRRLKENCTFPKNTSRSFEGLRANDEDNVVNKPITKPFVRSISTAKPSRISQELNSIEQLEEEQRPSIKNRPSETAGGCRKRISSTSNKDQGRPKTGKDVSRNRYFDSSHVSKTINVTEQAFSEARQSNKEFSRSRQYNKIQYSKDERGLLTRRRDFYEELEKEKSKQGDIFSGKQSTDILKKFKGRAHKRLWQKINRLL